MLKIINVRMALNDDRCFEDVLSKQLRIDRSFINKVHILSKAVDARKKDNITFVYGLLADIADEQKVLNKNLNNKNLSLFEEKVKEPIIYGKKKLDGEIVVAGAGPAGLFCALILAEHGYKPLLLERGMPIADRKKAVDTFFATAKFSSVANIQFGEGGAGTFSDGKLTTRVNDPVMKDILTAFVEAGAPKEIMYENKPHVGTDILFEVVKNISEKIRKNGGKIRYLTKLEDIKINSGKLDKIVLANNENIDCGALVLAIGHSARDTYEMLFKRKVFLESKPFSIGVRIEHPQEIIDKAQYGRFAGHEKLGAADYALVFHDKKSSRSAYSFCMCPGGVVVASASAENEVVTNGMSYFKRDSGIANSALVVGVDKNDFGNHDLDGIAFQRKWESLAFQKAGKNYCAPVQNVGSFLKNAKPQLGTALQPSYKPGTNPLALREVLPSFVTDTLANALVDFGRKIKGFDDSAAVLTGVETRTSAPVRIVRTEKRTALGIEGIYPTGEGAGYAGGIMSAAIDGYKTALAIMNEYKKP